MPISMRGCVRCSLCKESTQFTIEPWVCDPCCRVCICYRTATSTSNVCGHSWGRLMDFQDRVSGRFDGKHSLRFSSAPTKSGKTLQPECQRHEVWYRSPFTTFALHWANKNWLESEHADLPFVPLLCVCRGTAGTAGNHSPSLGGDADHTVAGP